MARNQFPYPFTEGEEMLSEEKTEAIIAEAWEQTHGLLQTIRAAVAEAYAQGYQAGQEADRRSYDTAREEGYQEAWQARAEEAQSRYNLGYRAGETETRYRLTQEIKAAIERIASSQSAAF